MDILDLSNELKNIRYNAVTLNLDERMQLEFALQKLQSDTSAEELLFWGKVNGLQNDYYICVAITYSSQYEFPLKKLYWCLSNNFKFTEMPDLNEQHKEVVDKDNSLFSGDPNKVIV